MTITLKLSIPGSLLRIGVSNVTPGMYTTN